MFQAKPPTQLPLSTSEIPTVKLTTEDDTPKVQEPKGESKQDDEVLKPTKSEATIETYTTASQLNVESEQGNKRRVGKPTFTELRMKESIFPELPRKGEYGTFQCTQCFEVLPEKKSNPRLWKLLPVISS